MVYFLYGLALVMALTLETVAQDGDEVNDNQAPFQRVVPNNGEDLAQRKVAIIAELVEKNEQAVQNKLSLEGLENRLQVAMALPMGPARIQTLKDLVVALTDSLNDSKNLRTEIKLLVDEYKVRFLGQALEA